MENTRDTSCGRTYRERFRQIKGEPSSRPPKRSAPSQMQEYQYLNLNVTMAQTNLFGLPPETLWETVTPSRGGRSTLNTGVSPNVVRESTLSQILIRNAPVRYYLSARACEGICNRALRRGKKLPLMLWDALMEVLERRDLSTETAHKREA